PTRALASHPTRRSSDLSRQDRKGAPRSPITAKLVADMITVAGASRVVTMDLHAGQIQGFFNIPFDNIFASPVILEYIQKNLDLTDRKSTRLNSSHVKIS